MATKRPLALYGTKIKEIASGDSIASDTYSSGTPGAANVWSATITFTNWDWEASATVTGLTGFTSSSKIGGAAIVANTDDVYAQGWQAPVIRNKTTGGFIVSLRPDLGTFKGPVTVEGIWS